MKPTAYLAGLSALAVVAPAYADVTVNVTGATAFRAAALDAIKAAFVASGQPFKFAHDKATSGGTTYNGATRSIWIGTFPGVAGTTTIRTCFSGSVEGIRSISGATDTAPPTYYQSSLLAGTTAVVGGAELANQGTTGAATDTSHVAYSDVSKASTPYASYSLQPSSPNAGVIVFTMIANNGSTITNVTSQQFRAIMAQPQPLSLFDGNPAHTSLVYGTGRNDGSGTRTTYLAETGYGIVNTVKQYVMLTSSGNAMSAIQMVPAGGVNSPVQTGQNTAYASTIWGQDVAGNGGYSSGGGVATALQKTGGSVTVYNSNYVDSFGSPQHVDLVSWLSVNDAVSAINNGGTYATNSGAVMCAFNGVSLSDVAVAAQTSSSAVMSSNDKAKVVNGLYTAWGYERMYCKNDSYTGDIKTVFDYIKAEVPTHLASAGLALTDMAVSRPSDGGTVAP